jgi:hypothetical protein
MKRCSPATEALVAWAIFIILAILLNGTIPFLLGENLHPWKTSTVNSILFGLIIYGVMFLTVPLILVKGWQIVKQPGFLIPLLLAVIALSLWNVYRGIAAVVVAVLAYLHLRYDLSDLGIRSQGWRGDAIAVILLVLMGIIPNILQPNALSSSLGPALLAGLDRLFANPASTVENLFYFGFLAERLSPKIGRSLTPVLIGLMYTIHEMTNPEYWYEGMNFPIVFVGVSLITVIYLWRRNVVAIWLGDGLRRMMTVLI